MLCPICHNGELIPKSFGLKPFTWQGKLTMYECYGDKCPQCGEIQLSKKGREIADRQIAGFKKKVERILAARSAQNQE